MMQNQTSFPESEIKSENHTALNMDTEMKSSDFSEKPAEFQENKYTALFDNAGQPGMMSELTQKIVETGIPEKIQTVGAQALEKGKEITGKVSQTISETGLPSFIHDIGEQGLQKAKEMSGQIAQSVSNTGIPEKVQNLSEQVMNKGKEIGSQIASSDIHGTVVNVGSQIGHAGQQGFQKGKEITGNIASDITHKIQDAGIPEKLQAVGGQIAQKGKELNDQLMSTEIQDKLLQTGNQIGQTVTSTAHNVTEHVKEVGVTGYAQEITSKTVETATEVGKKVINGATETISHLQHDIKEKGAVNVAKEIAESGYCTVKKGIEGLVHMVQNLAHSEEKSSELADSMNAPAFEQEECLLKAECTQKGECSTLNKQDHACLLPKEDMSSKPIPQNALTENQKDLMSIS